MKALFWIPPWYPHGDPYFFKNCMRKHLILQANLLAKAGWTVDFALPDILHDNLSLADSRIRPISLASPHFINLCQGNSDPSPILYSDPDGPLTAAIQENLAPVLDPHHYDVILLWETPAPFLERMYPDAVIVHQMPGIFSRPPYPHTVTFDVKGLFKHGSLYSNASDIQQRQRTDSAAELTRLFKAHARQTISELQPFTRQQLDPKNLWSKLTLLPLQVSQHYSFSTDTPFKSQLEFLLYVLRTTDPTTGVVATQYSNAVAKDTVLTPELAAHLQKTWPNLIYSPVFDDISCASQYLPPLVDSITTCSSSVAMQAQVWNRDIHVVAPTMYEPFDTARHAHSAETVAAQDATLGFILARQQPLASKVTLDQKFLTALLEDLVHRKRSGASGLDLFSNFHTIDPKYTEALLSSFNAARSLKDLGASSDRYAALHKDRSRFAKAVAEPTVKAISFDVFDTLIYRPTETPADFYKFLEVEANRITDFAVPDFAKIRTAAEVDTRERSSKGEITLHEIYDTIQTQYLFDDQIKNQLLNLEINLEIANIDARPYGQHLWNQAKISHKPIFIISDMYLPHEVVEAMLLKAGYSGWKELFVSSTYEARKKEGTLFDIILEKLAIPPSSLLHIGDNKQADMEQPASRGIQTHRIARALDRMRSNSLYATIFPPKGPGVGEKSRSAIAGLIASSLFEHPSGSLERSSHFQASPYNLGYACLGPLLSGFMLWLGTQAKRDQVTQLHFLSREGWVLKQVYDALHANDPSAVPSNYLYGSRRATRIPNLKTQADIIALAYQPFRNGVPLNALLQSRFALDIPLEVLEPFALNAGYESPIEPLSFDIDGKQRFVQIACALSQFILDHAATERATYLAYLQQNNLDTQENPAIVDLGWKANMQGAIGSLLQRPLTGYYYATLAEAHNWTQQNHKIWAYAGDFLYPNQPGTVISNRHILEFLTCHIEPSLLCINEKMQPVFKDEPGRIHRRALIEEVHRGAIEFASNLRTKYQHIPNQIHIDPTLAELVLASFIANPHADDAKLFSGQFFEDSVGGVQQQFIIHPSQPSESVWKQGADAIIQQLKEQTAAKEPPKPEPKPAPVKPAPAKTPKPEPKPEPKPDIKPAPAKPAPAKPATPKPEVKAPKPEPKPTPQLAELEPLAKKPLLQRIESSLVERFAPPKIANKHKRDREQFFADSKSPLLKTWKKLTK